MPRRFSISSHSGVGPLRFGMTHDQVRSALAAAFQPFSRTPDADVADRFPSIPAFAHYSANGTLEAVEFGPGATVTLGDFDLTEPAIAEAIKHLAILDPGLEREPSGCISKACGVGLWSERDFGEPAQSVIVFARCYCD